MLARILSFYLKSVSVSKRKKLTNYLSSRSLAGLYYNPIFYIVYIKGVKL